jgi:hypothetical protein
MDREPQPIRYSAFRVGFYALTCLWIALQPVFAEESAHFGWGFFPMLASIVVVPVLLGALIVDVVIRVVDATAASTESTSRRAVAIAIPSVVFVSSCAWLYHLYAA